ncbi:hypothetical protein Bbelb_251070 [Branchiostoma belcheri]|nr:hypothetical protein Bbelb_251070 [Branchiostoma belcheri]
MEVDKWSVVPVNPALRRDVTGNTRPLHPTMHSAASGRLLESGDRTPSRCCVGNVTFRTVPLQDRTIMVVSSNKDSPTVLRCLYLIKRAWNKPNSSNSGGKHRECYYRRPDNQDICLQYLCYQTTA